MKILDSWILGFLEVFLVFLILLGNSWISSKKPRITRVFWISSKKPRFTRCFLFLFNPAKNQEFPSKTRKPKKTSRKPRIQDFVVGQTSNTTEIPAPTEDEEEEPQKDNFAKNEILIIAYIMGIGKSKNNEIILWKTLRI